MKSVALVLLGAMGLSSASAFVLPGAPAGAIVSRSLRADLGAALERTPSRSCSTVLMAENLGYLDDPMVKPLSDDDYVSFGLACCFVMNSDNKLDEYYVLEPLTAGTLETIEKGVQTSYRRVSAFRAKDIFEGSPARPTGINMEPLQVLVKGEEASICEDNIERTLAAARTFKRRVEAQLVGFGEVADEYNFSTERKRILNHKYEPSFDDNVKQDKSIDVYGREDDEVATAKQIDDLANM